MDRVAKRADYAKETLKTCIAPQPEGLGLKDSVALSTKQSDALKRYIDFFISVANTQNWAMSLVAMIPCIQVCHLIFRIHEGLTNSRAPSSVLLPDCGEFGGQLSSQRSVEL